MNAIIVGLFACTSLFACATSESDDAPTTITGVEVTTTEAGGATVTGEGVSFELDDLSQLELDPGTADDEISTLEQRVGCEISSCESCTCYPDGKCICMNCKCISR
ncbi:MAG TPA: hypothetical protein VM513_18050 [Kofleriaceae bacterium]|nr:hypothetical protein [Kofleriaceae bacterium]